MNSYKNNFAIYLLKFLLTFCILYYGTIAWIGITSPGGGYYSAFAHKYLDYVSLMRSVLLHASKFLLNILGYDVHLHNIDSIKLPDGRGGHVGYDCIGYGVMSFWLAFIVANKVNFSKSMKWIIGGLLAIWIINVGRIALMLISIQQNWSTPFNLDNHTLFNIVAYTVIFTMIYLFDRSQKREGPGLGNSHHTSNAGTSVF